MMTTGQAIRQFALGTSKAESTKDVDRILEFVGPLLCLKVGSVRGFTRYALFYFERRWMLAGHPSHQNLPGRNSQ